VALELARLINVTEIMYLLMTHSKITQRFMRNTFFLFREMTNDAFARDDCTNLGQYESTFRTSGHPICIFTCHTIVEFISPLCLTVARHVTTFGGRSANARRIQLPLSGLSRRLPVHPYDFMKRGVELNRRLPHRSLRTHTSFFVVN
jgi:hypothetical protein